VSGLGLSGLVSGANTDDIIKKITDIEQKRINAEKQNMADLLGKQDAWHKVRDSLAALRTALDGIRLATPFQSRTVSLSDTTIASVTASAGAALTTHTLTVSKLAQTEAVGGQLVDSDGTYLASLPPAQQVTPGSILINGQSVSVTAQDTLQSLKSKINGTANIGVIADVVKVSTLDGGGNIVTKYRLTLTSKTSGATGITLANADPANDILAQLGVATGNGAVHNYLDANTTKPMNATFTFDGQNYVTATNNVTDLLPRMSVTLQKLGTTNITVGQDTSKAVPAVQSFVDALNSTLSLLSDVSSYDQSTGAHGPLNGDSTIRRLQTSLRGILSTQSFAGTVAYNNLGTVGVTSGAFGTSNYGKVLLDATKLTTALTTDEEGVARLFGGLRQNVTVAQALNWQSSAVPSAGSPQSLVLNFGGPKSVDQVYLTTPDGAPSNPTAGIKDFNLYYQDTQGNWQLLRNVQSYVGTSQLVGFDPVTTSAVKLEVTSTYGANNKANISELDAYEYNKGAAVQMYRYVNGTLAYQTGTMDQRDTGYTSQIKSLDDKIKTLTDQMTTHQQSLRDRFNQMEAAMSKLQAQGSSLSAMIGTGTSGK
jgi:flagellar hook-associated protein 2